MIKIKFKSVHHKVCQRRKEYLKEKSIEYQSYVK